MIAIAIDETGQWHIAFKDPDIYLAAYAIYSNPYVSHDAMITVNLIDDGDEL